MSNIQDILITTYPNIQDILITTYPISRIF